MEEDSNGDGKPDTFRTLKTVSSCGKDVDRKHLGKSICGATTSAAVDKTGRRLRGNGKVSRVLYFRGDEVCVAKKSLAARGRMDMIELFAQGRLTHRCVIQKEPESGTHCTLIRITNWSARSETPMAMVILI